jgi:SAM-dependent methyltransferase
MKLGLHREPAARPFSPAEFVEMAHRNVFGTRPGPVARRRYSALLTREGRLGLLSRMLAEPAHAERVVGEMTLDPGNSDETFVGEAYRALLDREPDPGGLTTSLESLAGGVARADIVRRILGSDEYRQLALRRCFPLVDLRAIRPDRYADLERDELEPLVLFRAEGPGDFDWIESAILDGGYYDKPGVWDFSINADKRLMAEVVGSLEPTRVLELGCASGPVLQCLHERGVEVAGVEISRAAIDSASPDVRGQIHQANASDFELPSSFDVIFGLDIFEHLNPNRLTDCLKRIEAHLEPGGFVFANIPAFGHDPVFGEVFPIYVDDWLADGQREGHYRTLHCDRLGYPMNGHLIWAHTDWWVRQFEEVGLTRQPGVETALHARYDTSLQMTPARRSFYVFAKEAR